jgi:hypothetical protein
MSTQSDSTSTTHPVAVTLPPRWSVVDENDQIPAVDQSDSPSIVITHDQRDITAELYLRTKTVFNHIDDPNPSTHGLNKWDITYVDPDGVVRDGVGEFYYNPQEAVDEFIGFIRF